MQRAGNAAMIDTASPVSGISCLGHEPHHYTIFYAQVEDVGGDLEKAVSLGGKSLVPPIDVPTGTFAWFAEPEGNTIGLFKPCA
jgi:predicted enzyme related to lactoylglutathione lyase